MKHLGNLLLVLALTLGALSAASAYLVPLSAPSETLVGLALNADAGVKLDEAGNAIRDEKGAPSPLYAKGHTLDEASVAALKAQRDGDVKVGERPVRFVHVEKFSLASWPGKWLFLGAVAGLAAGAMLVRKGSKAAVLAASAERAEGAETPEKAIDSLAAMLVELRENLPVLPDDSMRCDAIVERVGKAQRTHIDSFVEARPALIGRRGLGGFAAIMDRFAAAERQLNRAWSAAADNHYDEASQALEKASVFIAEVKERL